MLQKWEFPGTWEAPYFDTILLSPSLPTFPPLSQNWNWEDAGQRNSWKKNSAIGYPEFPLCFYSHKNPNLVSKSSQIISRDGKNWELILILPVSRCWVSIKILQLCFSSTSISHHRRRSSPVAEVEIQPTSDVLCRAARLGLGPGRTRTGLFE